MKKSHFWEKGGKYTISVTTNHCDNVEKSPSSLPGSFFHSIFIPTPQAHSLHLLLPTLPTSSTRTIITVLNPTDVSSPQSDISWAQLLVGREMDKSEGWRPEEGRRPPTTHPISLNRL